MINTKTYFVGDYKLYSPIDPIEILQNLSEIDIENLTDSRLDFVTVRYKKLQIKTSVFGCVKCKSKGKAAPLQAWTGPEGSSKLSFPDFVTTAQDGGKVVSLTHRPPLPPGNTPGTHF